MSKSGTGVRYAEVERETKETRIRVVLDLDGGTKRNISTGIGFFDHMLDLMAFHGQFDIGIDAEGDLHIDDHHTVEDIGIVLGQALKQAMGQNDSIARYADHATPMDEALVMVAVDICGRANLCYKLDFKREAVGGFSTELVKEFLKALVANAGITLHVHQICGDNDHHICEAAFKGLGRAIHTATSPSDRRSGISSKGSIG